MTSPIVVREFDLGAAKPTARDFVAAAVESGAAFVAADVIDGDDETPEAHVGGCRIAKLERFASEATRRSIGLFLRVPETSGVFGLRDALGVAKGTAATTLTERLLVVVSGERVGKRLRHDAPELPSALELTPASRRGLARFASPNFLRAAADADDLVVPWSDAGAARLVTKLASDLARRGARLWISDLSDTDLADPDLPRVAGWIVRRPYVG